MCVCVHLQLIASYKYPIPGNVPPPGTERWHMNVWAANAGAPAFGRRIHQVITNFQYTTQLVNFAAMGFADNTGTQRREYIARVGAGVVF